MEVKCKPRSRNFTEFEKNLLFEIVTNNYIDIIENKKTDGVSCAKKQVAWEEISVKFNSQAQTGPRTAKQLHSLYDILKKNARSNLHSDKRNLYKTGGGTFTPKSTILDEKIVALLKPQFQPLVNNSDSSQEYYANTNYGSISIPKYSFRKHSNSSFLSKLLSLKGVKNSYHQRIKKQQLITEDSCAVLEKTYAGIPLAIMIRKDYLRHSIQKKLRNLPLRFNTIPARNWMTNIQCTPGLTQQTFKDLKRKMRVKDFLKLVH
ncbi:hypothetical protein RN001_005518 [Aquatica leii]|uniref:Regulatory protein zeste n=1 Tax=Aquatica leii TaxID=1421715 RepID=A0AAN7Q0G7_9COLE|nr:hypothetical protein RN001_005518 [Aquatica leii]